MRHLARYSTGLWILALAAGGAVAAPGSEKPKPPATPEKTPQQEAVEHYNRGIAFREEAWSIERAIAESEAAEVRAKLEKKAVGYYERARDAFEKAVRLDPRMFEAHGDLGYCLRKLGDHEASLAAYDRALALEPGYGKAIEYRAETYLALGRLEDAKDAYLKLFASDRPLADQLLAAMRTWVDRGGNGVDATELEAFAGWVAEREEIAGQTKSAASLAGHDW